MDNRLFHVFAEWRDGGWHAITDEIEGRRFVATVASEVSDANDREALKAIEAQLRSDLLGQLEQTLGFPRQQTDMIVSCVDPTS